MSRLNSAPVLDRRTTYESARAWPHISAIQQLRRSVLSCMLWEDEHYEDGRSIAERITEFAEAVPSNCCLSATGACMRQTAHNT